MKWTQLSPTWKGVSANSWKINNELSDEKHVEREKQRFVLFWKNERKTQKSIFNRSKKLQSIK